MMNANPPDPRGGASVYNLLPDELDANQAAACLSLSLFGEPTSDQAGGEHGILLRFPVEPDRATLPERMLAFALIFSGSLPEVARRYLTTPNDLLSNLSPLMRSVWDELAPSNEIADLQRSIIEHIPSSEQIDSVGYPPRAWDRLVQTARDAEAQMRNRIAPLLKMEGRFE